MKLYVGLLDNNYNVYAFAFESNVIGNSFEYEFKTDEEYNNFINNYMYYVYKNNVLVFSEKLKNNRLKEEENIVKINVLKSNLASSDYKITKCYEAFMRQKTLPYNLEELSTQRDAWRAEINELEEELKNL
jgi:hypothetical protein